MSQSDYQVGYKKPPLHTRFKKGEPSANPEGRPAKNLAALLVAKLNEPVTVTENGRCRTITKREAVIGQLIDKSADADWRATKMLLDVMRDVEKKTGTPPSDAPSRFTAADDEVVAQLIERLRDQIHYEMTHKNAE